MSLCMEFPLLVAILFLFVWALAPFLVCFGAVLLFASFPLAKRKSGWGICGSSLFVWLWFSLVCFYRSADFKDLCPCTEF